MAKIASVRFWSASDCFISNGRMAPVRTIGTRGCGISASSFSPVLARVSVPCRRTMPPASVSCAAPARRTASTIRARSASVISRLSLLISSKTLTSVSSRRSSASIRRTIVRRLARSPLCSS